MKIVRFRVSQSNKYWRRSHDLLQQHLCRVLQALNLLPIRTFLMRPSPYNYQSNFLESGIGYAIHD